MQQNIKVAMSFLPPSILLTMKTHGFDPLRIEESGSLRVAISNSIPLEKKALAVLALKTELQQYGLSLARSFLQPGSAMDESCLVVKRGPMGVTCPLFKQTGELWPEIAAPLDVCLAKPVAPSLEAKPDQKVLIAA